MARNFPARNRPDQQEQMEPVEPMAPLHDVPVSHKKFSFVDDGLSMRILLGFRNQGTDVTITVGSVSIPANKCVLSYFSQYFEALFNSKMSDSNRNVITLHDFCENAVQLLINFAYSGCVEITEENVQDLMFVSSYLCVDSVTNACCTYLVKNLSVENCIDIYELARTLGQDKMKGEAETFMAANFKQLLSEGQFLRMNHETLRALLETDKLIVTENSSLTSSEHEETLLVDAVLRYVGENPEERHGHLTLLLSHGIRLLLLQKETIQSLISYDLVASSPECLSLLNRILSSEISTEEHQRWERQRYFSVPLEPVEPMAHAADVPVSCERFSFVDDGLSKRILSGFHKQWTDGQFLDVEITVGSVCIRAHKCVLSSFSQYFEAFFRNNINDDAGLYVITLQGICENAVELLIKFAYSGCVEITEENVQNLLFASSYLCVDSVIDACCTYLVKNLSIENSVDIHKLARTLGQDKMKDKAEMFMVSHLKQMLHNDQFLRMNHDTLRTLLEVHKLVVMENSSLTSAEDEEKLLVDAVLRYVGENPEKRHGHLTLLLSHGIRLLLLQKETIQSLKSSDLVASSPECLSLLNRILSSKISEEERLRWERPRCFSVEYKGTKELADTTALIKRVPSRPFDDSSCFHAGEHFYIVGMRVHTRKWNDTEVIGAIEVFYNTGRSVVHGSTNPVTDVNNAEFFIGQNDYITEINVQAGWMIDRLEFKTIKGKVYGPYGGDGGGQKRFVCTLVGAYLAYITGTVDVTQGADAVRKLRFFWGVPKLLAARQ